MKILPFIAGAIILSSCALKEADTTELYALRYGVSAVPNFNVFESGSPYTAPVSWMFWLLKEEESITLIDCGIQDLELLEKWKVEDYSPPPYLVSKLGIQNNEVTRIILSHGHGDHIDGCRDFPNAVIIMQQREFDAMRGAFEDTKKSQTLSKGYFRKNLEFLEEKRERGQLRLLDGDRQISNSLSVELAPYHTKGTQTVIIETNGERTILVPDNAYVMNNIEDLRAVGAAVSKDGNRTYLEKLKLLHSYPRTTVIPGHDVSIFKEFPLTQKNIARLR